jgi:hypothetical protein
MTLIALISAKIRFKRGKNATNRAYSAKTVYKRKMSPIVLIGDKSDFKL